MPPCFRAKKSIFAYKGFSFPASGCIALNEAIITLFHLRAERIMSNTSKPSPRHGHPVQPQFDLLPIMYFIVDGVGRILAVNRIGAETLGYAREELIGRSVLDVFIEEDRPYVEELLNLLRAEPDKVLTWEFRKHHKDGHILWVKESATRLLSEGDQEEFHILCEDITESRQMRERLREAEMRYRSLVEKVPAISYSVDLRGAPCTTFISPQVEFILGYTPEEWMQDREFWLTCIHPEDRDRVKEEVLKRNETGSPFFLEYRIRTKNGPYSWIRNHGVFLRDDDGTPRFTHGVMIDISDTKRIEDREQELQTKMARAERMESLGLLAGGVAHDLNNILGPLVGYPDILLETLPPDDPMAEDLSVMRDAAQRAAEVIQDLLMLARRGNVEKTGVDLNAAIAGYLASTEFTALQKRYPKVELVDERSEAAGMAAGSPTHLFQVIMNLVSNAFDAIEQSGHVTIRTVRERLTEPCPLYETIPPGRYVVLQVSDTGCGIPAADLEHIFEPFYTKKVMGRSGTGLGLSVVYGIIKEMDGYIDVQSDANEGTTLSLYLPESESTSFSSKTAPSTRAIPKGTERLLVVDDLSEQRDIATRLLANLGYEVRTAPDYDEALQLAKTEGPFDLALLDMILNGDSDGLDVFKALREIHPNHRALIISGYAETDRVHEAIRLGAHGFVRKPYTMEKIGVMVREALDATPSR